MEYMPVMAYYSIMKALGVAKHLSPEKLLEGCPEFKWELRNAYLWVI